MNERVRIMRIIIPVSDVKDLFNKQLANQDTSEECRKVLCVMIESILMTTKTYDGFQYVDWENGGKYQWVNDGKPEDKAKYLGPEHKRRYY